MLNSLTKEKTKEIIEKAAKLLKPFAKNISYTNDTLEIQTKGLPMLVTADPYPLRISLLNMREYLLEEAEEERSYFEDDIDNKKWCDANDKLYDLKEALDEIIPDECLTVTASDKSGEYVIKFHSAGLTKDEIKGIMDKYRNDDNAVYEFTDELYDFGCEPTKQKVDMAF